MTPNRTRAESVFELISGETAPDADQCIREIEQALDEAVREINEDRMRLQQEINCLRMPPCQLPHCENKFKEGTLKGLEMAMEEANNHNGCTDTECLTKSNCGASIANWCRAKAKELEAGK